MLLFSGVSTVLVRSVTVIWVNRRATSHSRATVHSLFGQAEYLGEIACATALAAFALRLGATGTTLAAAGLLVAATLLVSTRGFAAARGRRAPGAGG